jgi:hypothetical protein
MGRFDYDGPSEDSGQMVKSERCRPDFEGMIEKEREKMALMHKFYDVTREVVLSPVRIGFQMAKLKDLLGSLHVRLLASEKTIETLIRDQENYKD